MAVVDFHKPTFVFFNYKGFWQKSKAKAVPETLKFELQNLFVVLHIFIDHG